MEATFHVLALSCGQALTCFGSLCPEKLMLQETAGLSMFVTPPREKSFLQLQVGTQVTDEVTDTEYGSSRAVDFPDSDVAEFQRHDADTGAGVFLIDDTLGDVGASSFLSESLDEQGTTHSSKLASQSSDAEDGRPGSDIADIQQHDADADGTLDDIGANSFLSEGVAEQDTTHSSKLAGQGLDEDHGIARTTNYLPEQSPTLTKADAYRFMCTNSEMIDSIRGCYLGITNFAWALVATVLGLASVAFVGPCLVMYSRHDSTLTTACCGSNRPSPSCCPTWPSLPTRPTASRESPRAPTPT